jgi:transposase
MDVTPRKRTKIVTLHEHTAKTYRDIASVVGVSLATVSRVIKLKHETGSVSPKRKGNCGRKKKTSHRDDAYLIRQSKKDPRKTSDALNLDLKEKGIQISSSTVRRRLIAVGRIARKPVTKQLLTKAMKGKRYKWANKYKNWTKDQWRKVLFTDESHFFVQGQRSQHVRRSQGEKLRDCHIDQYVKHPQKKMFWGCFSYYGVGRLQPIEGMMRSPQYIEVLRMKVIPELEKTYPDGTGILQQDLAPCHTSKMVKKFMTEQQIQVLDWPGNSPDVNPIENLWAICKSRLRGVDCTTTEKLIQALIQVWYRDPKISSDCSKLVDSMPNRVQMLLKNSGSHIRY